MKNIKDNLHLVIGIFDLIKKSGKVSEKLCNDVFLQLLLNDILFVIREEDQDEDGGPFSVFQLLHRDIVKDTRKIEKMKLKRKTQ